MKGKVFIVGAGIGGVEFLTVRARDLICTAEVIISDALVDRTLLDLAPPQCNCIIAGKRGGQESIKQAEINQMLVEYCLQGKQVVRLKSGDPWIFGRSLPEISALQAANCDWEVVAGISSAIAAPMLAGIPLTEVEASSCFAVMTGHDLERLPWDAIAQIPTLVILMGTNNLAGLLAKLQEGKSGDTKIAIVRWCGRPEQQVWTGTLTDIQSKLPEGSLSPSVIIIGEVVKFHEQLSRPDRKLLENCVLQDLASSPIKSTLASTSLSQRWLSDVEASVDLEKEKLPLQGKRILVTRAATQASQFTDLLTNQGFEVIEMPTLAIVPPSSWEMLDQAIADLANYDWLILTSANAVESFFGRLQQSGKDSRALHSLKVAVVGRKTAEVLANYGITPDLVPVDFIADSLIDAFLTGNHVLTDKKLLFPRVQSGGREVLVEQLQQHGAIIESIPAYESGCPEAIDPVALAAIQSQKLDVITFASSKTVRYFCQLLDRVTARETWQTWIASAKIASIGPQTSKTCDELLGRVDCEAVEYTLDGLAEAIAKILN
ncbi:uroporphyrinogen-III C-methyltransferase [Pseudanabaena yagii]|uniref:uroporphyrinogen-III C-methyltransferase n=1 Tax=Pseudanabaena yagii GIHE-NHR1 TaxID=2722753 RepID=A0ABX1LN14_9CYAN|nr:uroporphyrinogen-III C-methyltransferase [Pseudanabaena yagii]NMF57529.1 uroporphyrinogen-III C-methyltransferase [Pseudanabaena yagii GIHE-NHR1]